MKTDTGFLDGLRFYLALWVAFGHLYKYMGGEYFIDLHYLGYLLLNNGPAVDGFMIITGFLMMFHYTLRQQKEPPSENDTIYKFYIRRFFRIYPLYFLAIMVAYGIFETNFNFVYSNYYYYSGHVANFTTTYLVDNKPTLVDLLYHLTLIHGFLPNINVSILGPAWSLSLEMQFYICFPFIFLFLNKKREINTIVLVLFSLISFILAKKLFGIWSEPGDLLSIGAPSILIHKLIFFTLGMLMSNVLLKITRPFYLIGAIVLCLPFFKIVSIEITVLIALLMFNDDLKSILPTWYCSVIEKAKKLLSGNFNKFGANISYSIYLMHMIIMPSVLHYAIYFGQTKYTTALIALLFFILANTVIGAILYQIIEKPFITFGKRIITSKYSNSKEALI